MSSDTHCQEACSVPNSIAIQIVKHSPNSPNEWSRKFGFSICSYEKLASRCRIFDVHQPSPNLFLGNTPPLPYHCKTAVFHFMAPAFELTITYQSRARIINLPLVPKFVDNPDQTMLSNIQRSGMYQALTTMPTGPHGAQAPVEVRVEAVRPQRQEGVSGHIDGCAYLHGDISFHFGHIRYGALCQSLASSCTARIFC